MYDKIALLEKCNNKNCCKNCCNVLISISIHCSITLLPYANGIRKLYITIFNIAYVTIYKPSIVGADEYGADHFIFEIFSDR